MESGTLLHPRTCRETVGKQLPRPTIHERPQHTSQVASQPPLRQAASPILAVLYAIGKSEAVGFVARETRHFLSPLLLSASSALQLPSLRQPLDSMATQSEEMPHVRVADSAPIIFSRGRPPREVLLSDEVNAKLLEFGMICLRLTPADSDEPYPLARIRDMALAWDKVAGQFLTPDDPYFKGGGAGYRRRRGESALGDLLLVTIKEGALSCAELRKDAWRPPPSEWAADDTARKRGRHSHQGGARGGGRRAGAMGTSASGRRPAGEHGVQYLDYSLALELSSPLPEMDGAERFLQYVDLRHREELFWRCQLPLTGMYLTDMPMPEALARQGSDWSLFHLGETTDLPLIHNQILFGQWGLDNPDSFLQPPYYGNLTPVLYRGGPLSFFCMHIEDYALPALNWLLEARRTRRVMGVDDGPDDGPPDEQQQQEVTVDFEDQLGEDGGVAWYASPSSAFQQLQEFAAGRLRAQGTTAAQAVSPFQQWCMLDPVELGRAGIPVTRFLQRPGDIILTAPGAVHWGVNLTAAVKVRPHLIPILSRVWAGRAVGSPLDPPHNSISGGLMLGIGQALASRRQADLSHHAATPAGCA